MRLIGYARTLSCAPPTAYFPDAILARAASDPPSARGGWGHEPRPLRSTLDLGRHAVDHPFARVSRRIQERLDTHRGECYNESWKSSSGVTEEAHVARVISFLIVTLLVFLGVSAPTSAQAATASQVAEAQRILTKLGIPTGPVDGIWGAQTAQGTCTFRQIAGLPVSRRTITTTDLAKLRQYNAAYASLGHIRAPVRNGRTTYLLATRTCQTMLYVRGGAYVRVMRISTGKPGYSTPVGNYLLGSTRPGWSCSTIYPGGCRNHNEGVNARYLTKGVLYSKYGNMYNKRVITGAYLLHGSTSVPTYPASHGCLRVRVSDADWMYRTISNRAGGIYLSIVGSY